MITDVSERALILAPHGRDGPLAAALLAEGGLETLVCASIPDLVAALQSGGGFALLTEEGIKDADLSGLVEWLGRQPEWSDFPFVLLTQKGGGIERNPSAKRFLDILGNVTFLERPFHPTTLISLAESALRGRRRQYEARSRLEELARGTEKYRSLFESIDAGFCIIEMQFDDAGRPVDYTFLEANPAFERQTGLTHPVGRSMRSLAPRHEDHWFEIYGAVAVTGEQTRFENHAEALDNRWYDVFAFRTGGPDSRRVAVLFTDISERRQMELALRESEESLLQLNETLEERVQQRSRELEQVMDALRQSQKLEAIGQLTGGVAHDFNNLLMAIMSSLNLLQRRIPDDPGLHRLIDNAMEGTKRGAALTQRMLAFARRQELSMTNIDVPNLAAGIGDLARQTLGPAWDVVVDVAAGLPSVLADVNQLEMALLNLLVNARDAMPEGGTIRVRAEERAVAAADVPDLPPGGYVALSVVDSGHGMDTETLRRAAEPFFTTKGVGKGTGLGLSMIHGFTRQIDGAFTLSSTPGTGTVATLWLPVSETVVAHTGEPMTTTDQTPPAGRLKILAVDDDVLILMNTAAMIEDLGHEVLEANSGEEALAMFDRHPDIDLLITDQAMPKMNGTQLVQRVLAARPQLPVILATGYGELPEGFERAVIRLGKPYGQDLLEQSISQAMQRVGS